MDDSWYEIGNLVTPRDNLTSSCGGFKLKKDEIYQITSVGANKETIKIGSDNINWYSHNFKPVEDIEKKKLNELLERIDKLEKELKEIKETRIMI